MGWRPDKKVHPGTQPNHGQGMYLRDARFSDSESETDLFHSESFIVIEREYLAFFFRQLGDGLLEQVLHLGPKTEEEWGFFGVGGDVVGEVLFFLLERRSHAQAAEFQAIEFREQGLELMEIEVHFAGEFTFRRNTAELGGEQAVGLLDQTAFAAEVAWSPIQFTQAIEDGAADPELGIRAELDVLGQIELTERVDEADDTRMNQIFQRDVTRKVLVDAAREVAHLGKLLHQHAFALSVRGDTGIARDVMFDHEGSSLLSAAFSPGPTYRTQRPHWNHGRNLQRR